MKHLKEWLPLLVLLCSITGTAAVTVYQVGELKENVGGLKTDLEKVENQVAIMRLRQYSFLTAAIQQGWQIPQALLGRAIVEGWSPSRKEREP